MSNYTKATNFATKDALTTGNPLKTLSGTELDDEFNAISVASATKANANNAALTGVPVAPTAAADTSTTQVATTAFVTTEANLKADLASPTFTGVPAAPTAAADTSTTQLATTAFVTTEANLKADLAGAAFTGAITTTSTVDGVDIATRDAILSSTTVTADAALPKAGGTMTGNTLHGDNVKSTFGTGGDLEIYHDGGTSHIRAISNTLIIESTTGDVQIRPKTGEKALECNDDGSVKVYYDGSPKIATTTTGVNVTGTVTSSDKLIVNTSGATNSSVGLNINTSGTNFESDDGIINVTHAATGATTGGYFMKMKAGGADKFTVKGNGDVNASTVTADGLGIGTDSPSYPLEVQSGGVGTVLRAGTTNVSIDSTGSAASPSLIFNGDADSGLWRPASNVIALSTTGTERMRIDSAGNVLVGKSASTGVTAGCELRPEGYGVLTRSGAHPLQVRRLIDDGDIIEVYKDTAKVGSIGVANSGRFYIGSGDSALNFDATNNAIYPWNATTNGTSDNTTDLGISSVRFKDAHLSGQVNTGTIVTTGNVGIGATPHAWYDGVNDRFALQVGNYAALTGRSNDTDTELTNNAYLSADGVWSSSTRWPKQQMAMSNAGDINFKVSPTVTQVAFDADPTVAWTTAMTIDTAGLVGIGTSAPTAKLEVSGPASITSFTGTSELGVVVSGSTAATDYSGIDFKGNSQTNPTARIAALTTGGGSKLQFGTSNSYGSGITNTAMTIDATGNVLVGTTTISGLGGTGNTGISLSSSQHQIVVQTASDVSLYLNRTGSNGAVQEFRKDGTTVGSISVTGSATAYNTSSDYRLKTDVQPMTGATATLMQLKPCNFEWISDGTRTDGFLAHELGAVIPAAAHGTKDAMKDESYVITEAIEATYDEEGTEVTAAVAEVTGIRSVPDMQGIDQSKVVPLLTAALQEAIATIAAMEVRLAALEV